MQNRLSVIAAVASLAIAMPVLAQAGSGKGGAPRGGGPETRTEATQTKDGAIIQWFATLDRGLAEAKRTGKPILFVSGAPHCSGVSGMWCPGKVKIDNGWLLRDDVIAASKDFVCIRLTSYESASEAAFVSKIEGNPVNTVFAILAPDGTPAVEVKGLGRGPGELFEDTAAMVKKMGEVAAKYPAHGADVTPALPITLDARLGLAVASADLQPLVMVVSADAAARTALEAKVAKVAWSPEMRGRFAYASTKSAKDVALTGASGAKQSVLIIEPDVFGASGKVVAEVSAADVDAKLAATMRDASAKHVRAEKSRRQLKQMALAKGIFFQTGIPVTGKKEAEDREKYRQEMEAAKKARAAG
jgi:hypothetical protein